MKKELKAAYSELLEFAGDLLDGFLPFGGPSSPYLHDVERVVRDLQKKGEAGIGEYDLKLVKVRETGRLFIVQVVPKNTRTGRNAWHQLGRGNIILAAYPKNPEHARAFASTITSLEGGGPAHVLPGSVYAASAAITQSLAQRLLGRNRRKLVIKQLQGSHRLTPELREIVGRNYEGARNVLLDYLFRAANNAGVQVAELRIPFYWNTEGRVVFRGRENKRVFKQVAESPSHGFAVENNLRKKLLGPYYVVARKLKLSRAQLGRLRRE